MNKSGRAPVFDELDKKIAEQDRQAAGRDSELNKIMRTMFEVKATLAELVAAIEKAVQTANSKEKEELPNGTEE